MRDLIMRVAWLICLTRGRCRVITTADCSSTCLLLVCFLLLLGLLLILGASFDLTELCLLRLVLIVFAGSLLPTCLLLIDRWDHDLLLPGQSNLYLYVVKELLGKQFFSR